MSKNTVRTTAAQITYEVVYKKHNLSEVFIQRLKPSMDQSYHSAVKSLCYQTIRFYLLHEDRWMQHIDKRPKDKMVRVILTQAVTEFITLTKPKHVVVNEANNAAKKLNKRWATGLINSCLRKAVEDETYKPTSELAHYAHPQWWLTKLKEDWPSQWQNILTSNNKQPPLWIRSSSGVSLPAEFQQHERIKSAYKIPAQDITGLELFKSGRISVQDASAQLAAHILQPEKDDKILDACAAPGGKTGHLLELNSNISLDALEIFPNRAKKIEENLKRIKHKANIIIADASTPEKWFSGDKYDKILLDVPCSASGILRRHVDIKFLRQEKDLSEIKQTQVSILNTISTLLKPNGLLLYATCSVFREENEAQIDKFLKTHPEFSEITLKYPFAVACHYGIQIITGTDDMDGFYYCLLQKKNVEN